MRWSIRRWWSAATAALAESGSPAAGQRRGETAAGPRRALLHKRIDTTLRGGIGFEIDAMLEQLPQETVAVVVPAMPQSAYSGWRLLGD
jgi:uncharacterized protein YgbK (DUF1537 family)